MLSQVIYTRCSNGRDLLKDGQLKIGSGFKAFSFSQEILTDGNVDLPFIEDVLKKELPYDKRDAIKKEASYVHKEGEFTDEAYIYFVPDFGLPFIMEFTVRIYVQGFSDRPGNFINHAFIGKLNGYPCNFFHSTSFEAKKYEEAYYYQYKGSEEPKFLECVDGLIPNPAFSFESVGEFVKQGERKRILQNAVWFILKEFEKPAEQRRFIIIKALEYEIELWIAAINYAFSPDIAQLIPFATRLNRPTMENKYNTTLENKFSKNPSAFVRTRAMIVGIDTRDAVGVRDLRPMPNSPYILLDEIQADANDLRQPYFSLITKFNEEHKSFVYNFLRCQNKNVTLRMIQESYSAFKELTSDVTRIQPSQLSRTLHTLKNNHINNIPNWDAIKEVALSSLRSDREALDLAKLVVDMEKNCGITDDSFLASLCDHLTDELIRIAQGSIADEDFMDLTACWWQAKVIFKGTEYYKIFCSNIVELCPDKVSFEYWNVRPHQVETKVQTFFDIYVSCMSICGIEFNNEKPLMFIAKELSNLLNADNGLYNSYAMEILKNIQQKNKYSISYLRRVELPASGRMKDFIRRNFGEEIVPVKTTNELISICEQKVRANIKEKDLEYFLADYYTEGSFTFEVLINKVLATFVPDNQVAKEQTLPYPYGLSFFDKCIEQHSDDFEYVEIISGIMSSRIMLSPKTQVELLSRIDAKLARFLPNGEVDFKDYVPATLMIQVAEKIIKSEDEHIYPNSFLILYFSKLINKQIALKVLIQFAGYQLTLPNAEYGDAVIAATSKIENLTTDQHFALLAVFAEEKNPVYSDFVSRYLNAVIDNKKVAIFTEMTELAFFNSMRNKEHIIKVCKDIYGDTYNKNKTFKVVLHAIKKGLQRVYDSKFVNDKKVISVLLKAISKDEDLAKLYEEVYGLSTDSNGKVDAGNKNSKSTSGSTQKADEQRKQGTGKPTGGQPRSQTSYDKRPATRDYDEDENDYGYQQPSSKKSENRPSQNTSHGTYAPSKQRNAPSEQPKKKQGFFGKIFGGLGSALVSDNNDDKK